MFAMKKLGLLKTDSVPALPPPNRPLEELAALEKLLGEETATRQLVEQRWLDSEVVWKKDVTDLEAKLKMQLRL